ncbi:hypothetical protein TNCV_926741 [Trichonephila clavipes]|nr:hypothetical protein TNCV_926741 [Trichonephila clavipes]
MYHVHRIRGAMRRVRRNLGHFRRPDMPNTPERLRVCKFCSVTALKCSENRLDSKTRSSKITSGHRAISDHPHCGFHPLRGRSGKQPSASPHRLAKQTPLKKQAKSERKLHPLHLPRHIEGAESSME